MTSEVLRATEAARRLGVPTRELLRLLEGRKIRYVMVEGIAHVPVGAVDEYRAKAS
jgi:excisionase family DNA binding protein